MLKIKLVDKNAVLPKRAHNLDAGLDLYSPMDVSIAPHQSQFIDLGFQMALHCSTVGLIFARSGLGSKHGVRPRNCVGVIDSQYRGNVGIMLENASDESYEVRRGDRIAQMVVMPISLCEVQEVDELEDTARSGGGFGSSGK